MSNPRRWRFPAWRGVWGVVLFALVLPVGGRAEGEEPEGPVAPPATGLHAAVLQGDLETVRQHVAAGTDLDAKDAYGSTPLAIAATFGRTEIARALLEGGADPDVANQEGSTALHVAALLGREEIVKLLLAAGADRFARNDHGSAPIDVVAAPIEVDRAIYDRLRTMLGPLGLHLDDTLLRDARPRIFDLLRPDAEALAAVRTAPLRRGSWRVSTPAASGLSPSLVAELYDDAAHLPTLHALLLAKNGDLVAEGYFHGGAVDRAELVQSVTKSVTSALVGIAIGRGALSGLDAKLLDSFPEVAKRVKDARKRGITIRQMLSMRAGFPWEESSSTYWKTFMGGDYVPCLADFPLVRDPGTGFAYSNVSSHLLGVTVSRACGTDLLDLAREALFGPIGVEPGDWYADPRGYRYGHALLWLRARDMARFGRLYLDEGRWDGVQVVPASWVKASLEPHSERVSSAGVEEGRVGRYLHDVGYGYQWWSATAGDHHFAFAWGHGGQLVVLLPDLDVVIVTAAEPFLRPVRHDAEAWKHEQSILNLVGKFIRLLPPAAR